MTPVRTAYFALVPAAGAGSRFGAPRPKQYLDLAGRPLIAHAIAALLADPRIERVFVVLSPGDEEFGGIDFGALAGRIAPLYCGGVSRAASVANGLVAIGDVVDLDDWVLVHDAARPCVPAADVARLIDTLADDPVGGLLAVPVADTLKRAGADGHVDDTVDRGGLWRALTPQMFRYGTLMRAMGEGLMAGPVVTDEASAVERLGLRPRLIAGSAANLKVTLPEDLVVAARLLGSGRKDEGS